MEFDRGELQVLGDVRVLDAHDVLDVLALNDLGHIRRASNGRATAEGLKDGFLDSAIVVDFDL